MIVNILKLLKKRSVSHSYLTLALNLGSFLNEIWNKLPYVKGKERPIKKADHSRLVGDRFNKWGNLTYQACVGGHKTSRSLHLGPQILKVYIEALTAFSQIYYPDGPNNTLLSQVCVLENNSHYRSGGWNIPRTGKWVRSFRLPGSSFRVNQQSRLLNDFLQHFIARDQILQSSTLSSIMWPEQSGRVSLTGIWLVWKLSGCITSRNNSINIGTCKRIHRLK